MSPMALAYSCRATRLDRETAKEVVGCQLNVQERQEQDISFIYMCIYEQLIITYRAASCLHDYTPAIMSHMYICIFMCYYLLTMP
jgi:hypothetical protein